VYGSNCGTQICIDGICATCVPGNAYCNGSQIIVTCDNNYQWNPSPCPNGCYKPSGSNTAVCVQAADCTWGAKQCNGNVTQVCMSIVLKNGTPTLTWKDDSICPLACVNGSCGGICSPGAKQCSGSTVQVCDSTGQWQDSQSCGAYPCCGGVCGTCSTGSKQCSASLTGIETCNTCGQ